MVAGGLGGMHGCRGACVVAGEGMCRTRRDTVNEWVVHILLECILVDLIFQVLKKTKRPRTSINLYNLSIL